MTKSKQRSKFLTRQQPRPTPTPPTQAQVVLTLKLEAILRLDVHCQGLRRSKFIEQWLLSLPPVPAEVEASA